MRGVDISKYQSKLQMIQIISVGYDFVILRGGYTGYGENRTKNKDNTFEKFYMQSRKYDVPVGVYYYSCARSRSEGEAEAAFLYENCLKGKKFEMPIYIDVEDYHWQVGHKDGVTDAIIGFCDYLEARGYFVGVYASLSWFNSQIDTARLEKYTKWVAAWSKKKPVVKFKGFDMWQCTDNGKIGTTRVDVNESFVDFPSLIKRARKNGYSESTVIEAPKATVTEVFHDVKAGDTLSAIAKRYNTTVDALVQKNAIKDKNKIYVGQRIKI